MSAMPVFISDPVTLVFFAVAFALFVWIAWDGRRALNLLFMRQARVRNLPESRVRLLRGIALIAAISDSVAIVQALVNWGTRH